MPSNTRLRWFLLASLLCAVAAASAVPCPASAQQPALAPPAPAGHAPATQGANRRITLDVVVTSKSGTPAADLQQADFTLVDDKTPQTITSFRSVSGREAPLQILLVMDAVNTTAQNIIYERQELEKFLRADGGHLAYPLALAILTDKGAQIVGDYSSDGNALSAKLESLDVTLRIIGRDTGYNGAVELSALSLDGLSQLIARDAARPGRKVMLWVSPGWPLLSGPATELDDKQEHEIFGNIVALSTQIQRARVTIYSIDPLGTAETLAHSTYYQEFLKGVGKPSDVNMGDLGLQVLAVQSGGLALDFANDIAGQLQKCVADAAPYYEISFNPPRATKKDTYHSLEIRLAKPGLVARTRTGYYAEPSPGG